MEPSNEDWIFFMTVDRRARWATASDDAGFRKLKRKMCDNNVLDGNELP